MNNFSRFFSTTEKGSALINTLVAAAIMGIILMGVLDMSNITSKLQSNLKTTIDQGVLIDDIRSSLKNPDLCMERFGKIQGQINLSDTSLKLKVSTGESISGQNTLLSNYSLDKVGVIIKSSDLLATDPVTNKKTMVFDVALKSAKKSGQPNRERALGSLFVVTDSAGKIENCSFESVANLVECPTGQVMVSQGAGAVPKCDTVANLAANLCAPNEVLVSQNGTSKCESLTNLYSSACPSGQMLVSGGNGAPSKCATLSSLYSQTCGADEVLVSGGPSASPTCKRFVAAVASPTPGGVAVASPTPGGAATAAASPTPTGGRPGQIMCGGGTESVSSPDGKSICTFKYGAVTVGQEGKPFDQTGPLTLITGTCQELDGVGKWDWRVKCGGDPTQCTGGAYFMKSLSGNTTCAWDFKQALDRQVQGPLSYSSAKGNGTVTGTCLSGAWQYYASCNDAGTTSCVAGEEKRDNCWFRWSAGAVGETKSVYDTNSSGSKISATCDKSGVWTNITISPNYCVMCPSGTEKVGTLCSFPYPSKPVGWSGSTSDANGSVAKLYGSCGAGGKWTGISVTNDSACYKWCSGGVEPYGKCSFSYPKTMAGNSASASDSNGSKSVMSATCDSNGNWKGITVSPNNCN